MKKLTILGFALVILFSFTFVLGASDTASSNNEEEIETKAATSTATSETSTKEKDSSKEMKPASKEIIGTVTKKDERIQTLTEKYNNKTLGTVAYGLEVVRFYSTPVLFIFIVIGAFNFFIVGNKKLDKKEQGFGWITGCLVGWVFFQCLPLIFALFTIGAR